MAPPASGGGQLVKSRGMNRPRIVSVARRLQYSLIKEQSPRRFAPTFAGNVAPVARWSIANAASRCV